MTPADHPPPRQGGVHLAAEAPLARSALAAAFAGVVLGFCFVPQLLGLALGGISLTREPEGRRHAALAIALSLVLTVVWGVLLGALLKWWAGSVA
ncbi:hypothetical protein [Intrasporangium sp. DVR]|uniref:hypothetical protein n=1 Tax=Intrasporangium sp. DVR TaxID=3127867 RepID=UPI00313A530F